MRIALLGHRDIASLLALHRLTKLLPEHEFVVFFSEGTFASQKDSVPALDDLAAFDAALVDRWCAGEFGERPVPELSLDDPRILNAPNSPQGLAELNEERPDLVVSVRYRRILRDDAIRVPSLGVINIHSGPLPDYRGVMATFWAMLNGEPDIGSTIHWIVDGGIDTGPIIDILHQRIDEERSYLGNVIALYRPACDRLASVIRELSEGKVIPSSEQPDGGAYFSMPQLPDVEAFHAAGYQLCDAEVVDEIQQHLGAQV